MSASLSLQVSLSATHFPSVDKVMAALSGSVITNFKGNKQKSNNQENRFVLHLPTMNGQPIENNHLTVLLPQASPHDYLGQLAIDPGILIQIIIAQDTTSATVIDLPINDKNLSTIPPHGVYFRESDAQFFIDGQPIPPSYLSDVEHRLLKYLYENSNRVCSYHHIAKQVWCGWIKKNTISQRIYLLRKKLKKIRSGASESYIQTCRGHIQGYMLTKKR